MKQNMKDYSDYSAAELAQDEDFVRWIDDESTSQNAWRDWFQCHPEKATDAEEAKRIIKAVVGEKQFFLHDSKQQVMWSKIEDGIFNDAVDRSRPRKLIWYSIAASITIVIIGLYIYLEKLDLTGSFASDNSSLLAFSNESNKPSTIVLVDGSVVTLQPRSTLRYPEVFSDNHRDVYLTGEAFFEVTKNPKKPFSVYSNAIVTRVLGTSFTVRAYENEKNVVVFVKTGKVSVLTKEEAEQNTSQSVDIVGTLLTPNQQMTFSKEASMMTRSLVKEPLMLSPEKITQEFDFVDTPIKTVFDRLEKAYGVEIIFDEELLSNCYLNASLENDSFHDKLRLICKGINANYQLLDGHVIITGNGC